MAPQKAKHFISLGHSTVDLSAPFKIICDNYPKVFLRVGPLEMLMVKGVVIHGWVGFRFRVTDSTSHFPAFYLIRQSLLQFNIDSRSFWRMTQSEGLAITR